MTYRPKKHIIAWKNKIADALDAHGHTRPSITLHQCAEEELLLICQNCATQKYVTFHCQSRICPVCSWKTAKDRARFADALLAQMKYPKFLTLTMPRWTSDPRDGIKHIRSAFTKLREQKLWRGVKGGLYQIELKEKSDGWHIHIHILMDAPYIPKQHIFSAWRDALNLNYASIDLKACRTKQQRDYVTKYVSKAETFKGDADAVVRWYEATKGSRLFGTFGTWYNAKLEDLLNPDEHEIFRPCCTACGMEGMMFFARDGPFIFGHDRWLEEGGSWIGSSEISRPVIFDDDETETAKTEEGIIL